MNAWLIESLRESILTAADGCLNALVARERNSALGEKDRAEQWRRAAAEWSALAFSDAQRLAAAQVTA